MSVEKIMTGIVILLAVLVIPYIVLNLRRLRRGRRWAFTACQVAKEWAERDRARQLAAAAADGMKTPAAGAGQSRSRS